MRGGVAGHSVIGMEQLISGEPTPGYVVRGPYSDGTFRVFSRAADGAQHFIGAADDYESAREIALSDSVTR